jgi:hypothetical protein
MIASILKNCSFMKQLQAEHLLKTEGICGSMTPHTITGILMYLIEG